MRDILFRGQTNNGEWVYGYIAETTLCGCSDTHLAKVIYKIPQKIYDAEWFEVNPETTGQYTGLTDKNGVRIFEGDIVKIADFQIGQVVSECGVFGIAVMPYIDWDYLDSEIAEFTGCNNSPHFCYNDNFISFWELMWNYSQEENNCYVVEVIGNIHDNPELLKGGTE